MNRERIDAVIARKRLIHPELQEALTWKGFLAICAREGITVVRQPLPRDATLVNFDGEWTIGINSAKVSSRHDTADGAHELAHLWIHVDETPVGRSLCFNHGYGDNPDPREDEADYCAAALLYGPRYFPAFAPVSELPPLKVASALKVPDLSPIELKADGTFTVLVKRSGELVVQAALTSLFENAGGAGEDAIDVTARLVPESDNVFDAKAVRVEIDTHFVGYLSSADARRYRRHWRTRPGIVRARIVGTPHPAFPTMEVFSVRLDLVL